VQPHTIRDFLVAWRNVEEELAPMRLEVNSIGCLVKFLEGEELRDF